MNKLIHDLDQEKPDSLSAAPFCTLPQSEEVLGEAFSLDEAGNEAIDRDTESNSAMSWFVNEFSKPEYQWIVE